MKPAVVLPLALTLFLLLAIPVAAAPPVVETGTFEDDYVPWDPSPCPGIVVRDHEVGTYRLTTFFDNTGNPVRFQWYIEGFDNLYNPANPDVVLSGHFVHNVQFDARAGAESHTGIPIHITAPGYGTVMVLAGRWSQFPNGHLAGKDSFNSPTDMAQFCSLLGAAN
jgi:hypothetical protein